MESVGVPAGPLIGDPRHDDPVTDVSATGRPGDNAVAPTLDAGALSELAEFGQERPVMAGEVLYRAGDASYDFFVVLDGRAEIVRQDLDGETVIASYGAGTFLGELNLLTGQRPYLTARVVEAGRVLQIARDDFRRLMSAKPDIADLIFNAFAARRELLRQGDGAGAIRIVGSRYSPEALALRAFATRFTCRTSGSTSRRSPDPDVLLASMGLRPRRHPAVVTSTAVLRHTVAWGVRGISRTDLPTGSGHACSISW